MSLKFFRFVLAVEATRQAVGYESSQFAVLLLMCPTIMLAGECVFFSDLFLRGAEDSCFFFGIL